MKSESSNQTGTDPSSIWAPIRCLLLDSDGVLTDGGVYIGENDAPEFRRFDIKDGYGIAQLIKKGMIVGIISKSPSTPVQTRGERLGIQEIHLGTSNKLECAEKIRKHHQLEWSEIAFMGDDVPDLELLAKAGLALAPKDATKEVLCAVDWVSEHCGGHGAVREVADCLLTL